MKSSAWSSRKFAHVTVRSWEAVKGALKAFISTLDSLPGSLTIERANEAKRQLSFVPLLQGFVSWVLFPQFGEEPNGNPETHLFALS